MPPPPLFFSFPSCYPSVRFNPYDRSRHGGRAGSGTTVAIGKDGVPRVNTRSSKGGASSGTFIQPGNKRKVSEALITVRCFFLVFVCGFVVCVRVCVFAFGSLVWYSACIVAVCVIGLGLLHAVTFARRATPLDRLE